MNEKENAVAVVSEIAQAPSPQKCVALFAGNPSDVLVEATKIAKVLSDVVKKQNLISNIQGKEYPRCEAWTLLGTMLGVFPVLEWTRKIEGGWEARVNAQTMSGAIVGAAEAMCLDTEKNWGNRDDYAIRSMAQTRATAKALRMPLGFVMTLGGFEATPAEEMTFDMAKPATEAPRANTGHSNGVSSEPFNGDWRNVRIPFGKNKGKQLGELTDKSLSWYIDEADIGKNTPFRAALDVAKKHLRKVEEVKDVGGSDDVPF